MNEYIGEITLDLDCRKTTPQIAVGQFDKGRKYLFHITANGRSFSASNSTAIIQGVRSDKSHFSAACSVDQAGNVVLVLSEEILSKDGYAYAKLVLSDSTKNYSTQVFIIDIDNSFEGDITHEENYSLVNDFINRLMLLFDLNDPADMLSEYSCTKNVQLTGSDPYPNVDTAIENDVIYRCFGSGSGSPRGWVLFCGAKNYVNQTVTHFLFDRVEGLKFRTGTAVSGSVTWTNTWRTLGDSNTVIDSATSAEWDEDVIPTSYAGNTGAPGEVALREDTGTLWYLYAVIEHEGETLYSWFKLADENDIADLQSIISEKMNYAVISPTAARILAMHVGQLFVPDDPDIAAAVKTAAAGTAGDRKAPTKDYVDSAKAPIISVDTDPAYDTDLSELAQENVSGDLVVKAQQGTLGHTHLLLSEGASLFPHTFSTVTGTGTTNGVTVEFINGNSLRLNGTCTADFWIIFKNPNSTFSINQQMSGGDTATVGILSSGTATGYSSYASFVFKNGSGNTSEVMYFKDSGVKTKVKTLAYSCTQMTFDIKILANAVYDNYVLTPFVFAGSDVTAIENPVYTEGLCDISSAVSEYDYLSTFPNKHTVRYKADTKTYIDNKEIDPVTVAGIADQRIAAKMPEINNAINVKATYITPEQFGAKGDGVTDDTQALQAALSRAGSEVCVLALKYYKVSDRLRLVCDEGWVEINRIKYTGNDFAIRIAANNSRISIKQIESSTGGGVFINDDNSLTQVYSNNFEFNYIYTKGDSIKFEATSAYHIAYNSFKLKFVGSSNGHLININKSAVENFFLGGKISCPNGWCIYKSMSSNTFMRFSFEYAVDICYGYAKFIDCRTAEALNYQDWKGREGTFIKLDSTSTFINQDITDKNTPVTFTGVDVTGKRSFAEAIALINDRIAEQDPDDPKKYYYACSEIIDYSPQIIEYINRYRAVGTEETLDGKMVLYWNKKAYVPNHEIIEDVTTTPFVPLSTVINNPTYFRIGVANCVINLNDSYCPVGIDSFIVEQTSSYKASIYNKDNTLIFDGANLPAGKYKVSCYVTPNPSTIFDSINMPAYDRSYYATRIRYMYTGSNEAWKVEPFAETLLGDIETLLSQV